MSWLARRLTPRAFHPGLLALGLATRGLLWPPPVGQSLSLRPASPVSWLGAYRRLVEDVLEGRHLETHQRAVSRAVDYLEGLLAHPRRLGPLQAAELQSVQDDLTYLLELIDERLGRE